MDVSLSSTNDRVQIPAIAAIRSCGVCFRHVSKELHSLVTKAKVYNELSRGGISRRIVTAECAGKSYNEELAVPSRDSRVREKFIFSMCDLNTRDQRRCVDSHTG